MSEEGLSMMGGQRCAECLQRVCECPDPDDPGSDSEQEQDSAVRPLEQTTLASSPPEGLFSRVGAKKPRMELFCEETFEEPDLDKYFNEFLLGNVERIRLCRTYANYLAQLEGAKREARKQREEKFMN